MAGAPPAATKRLRWRWNVPLLAGLAATILAALLQLLELTGAVRWQSLDNLEARSLDMRFKLRGPRALRSHELAIIGIDDATRSRYPEVFQRRRGWATLLTAVSRYQPELIGIDAFFARPEIVLPGDLVKRIDELLATTPAPIAPEADPARALLSAIQDETRGDARLADAIAVAGNVYLGFVAVLGDRSAPATVREPAALSSARYDEALSSPSLPRGARAPSASTVIATHDAVASHAAGAGAVNSLPDPDHTIRRAYLVVEHAGRHYAPLGLALLRRHLQLARKPGQGTPPDLAYVAGRGVTLGGRRLPSDARGRALLDFLPPGAFPTFSAADVIDHSVPEAALRGKVVLIGFTDAARDKVATPLAPLVDGVELHATLFHNALHGELLTRTSPTLTLLIIVLLGLYLSALQLRPVRRRTVVPAIAAVLGIGAYLIVAHLAFTRARLWLPIATPLVAYVAIALITLGAALATEGREKLKLRGAFEHYVGDRLIDQILSDPSKLRLGGERRVLTVLFSDIRGFSAFSERLDPEELARFLNEYLTPMTQIVLDEDGLLDKYIGDAVMAVYGAPLVQRDHAIRACRSALRMQSSLADLNRGWQARGLPAIAIGVGLNTGMVSVGNMGSATRFDYTVMGDAVNLGSRLEALTKDYDVRILCGEATYAEAEADFLFREVDLVRVKGKDRPARVYELLAAKGSPEETAARARLDLERFARGLDCYRAGDFAAAIPHLEAALAKAPDDGPAATLLARARTLVATPPAAWTGVYDQLTK